MIFFRSVGAPATIKEKQTHIRREMKGNVAMVAKGIQSVVSRLEWDPSPCPVTLGKSLKLSLPLLPHV